MTADEQVRKRPVIKQIEWDQRAKDAALEWGVSQADCEAVVRHPQRSDFDPHSYELGHPVIKHYGGDLLVVTGYQDPSCPRVLYVITQTGQERKMGSQRRDSGSGSTLPKGLNELRKRIHQMGYTMSKHPHPQVRTKDGHLLMTLPGTPSDHRSVANTWRVFLKAHNEYTSNVSRRRKEQ